MEKNNVLNRGDIGYVDKGPDKPYVESMPITPPALRIILDGMEHRWWNHIDRVGR